MGTVLSLAFTVSTTTTSKANEITIAALGDSLTQGFGLPNGQGFVPQLEAWLKGQGEDIKIINAGVSGDTTAGGVRRIDWTLQDDVDALIVTLGANDLLRGIDVASSRENIDTILTKARAKGVPILLVGLDVPGNFGGEYELAFEAIYPDMAEKHGTLLFGSFMSPLIKDDNLISAFLKYMQPDGMHPNALGVAKIVDGIGPSVLDLTDLVRGSSSGPVRLSDRPRPRPAAP